MLNNSTQGLCHIVMHSHITTTTMKVSIFGLINSICLVCACVYLLIAMQKQYFRAYASNDGPLQRLLLGYENNDNNTNHSLSPFGHRFYKSTQQKAKQKQPFSKHSTDSNYDIVPTNSYKHSTSSSSSSSSSGVVLPHYYMFCLFSCFTFVLQACVWLIPPDTYAFTIGVCLVFTICMCNDFLLLIHLLRPPGANAKESALLAIIPAGLVLFYVLKFLPGDVAPQSCAYCCVHFPKPGIEIPWLITGLLCTWIGFCAEFRMSLLCCCGHKKYIPRSAVASWCVLIAIPYLASSTGIFFLHYSSPIYNENGGNDMAYCALVISDLIYSLGYAPIFLAVVTNDSNDCREIRMKRALNIALGDSGSGDGSGSGSGNGNNNNNNNNNGNNLTESKRGDAVIDIVTDPRLNLINPIDMNVTGKIGSGGFGDVYKAVWHKLPVAVKRLKGVDTNCSNTLKELSNEAGMLSELRHPNVVLFLGIVLTHEYCAVVTEFMEGGSVRDALDEVQKKTTTLSNDIRLLVLKHTAQGMVHLHALNVLHRDLKTQNLLTDHKTNPRTVKICDMGLSTYKEKFLKKTLTAVGTPQYAAPEVLRHDRYSEKADVYSFAVVAWELFQPDGKFPFEDISALRAAHEVAYSGLRPSPDVPLETPTWVKKLITNCWVNDPNDRPSFCDILKTIEDAELYPENRAAPVNNLLKRIEGGSM